MEKELKQEFVRRITQSNRSELILCLYDMAFVYLGDAQEAAKHEEWAEYKRQIGYAEDVIIRLCQDLNFSYEIAGELYILYRYCLVELAKEKVTRKNLGTAHAKMVLKNLYPGMEAMVKQDDSEPLMRHTQQVVAGMTYHKGNLTEMYQDPDTSRGFWA